MVKADLRWNFPTQSVFFMRIEIVAVAVIAVIIFFLSLAQIGAVAIPILLAIAFMLLYIVVSFLIQKVRKVEEKYELTKTHLHVTRKSAKKTKKEKVPLQSIKHSKLDRVFLGGYLISEEGKHLLFFNSKEELEKFEKFVKKHSKPTKRKTAAKKKVSKKKVVRRKKR